MSRVLRSVPRPRRLVPSILVLTALGVLACRRDANGTTTTTTAPPVVDAGRALVADGGSFDAAPPDASFDASGDAAGDVRVTGWKMHKETRGGRIPVPMTIPRVTTTSAAADAAFAAAIEQVIADQVKAFLKDAREESRCASPDEPPGNCSMPIDCKVALARGHGFSARCDATPYTGGAHPSKDVFALDFVLEGDAVRPLRIDDLAVDAGAKRKLLKKALAALDAKEGSGLGEMIGSGVFTDRDLPFTIERGGAVRFVFTDLPFAVGPQDVRLDARATKGLVRAEVLAAFE